MEGSAVVAVQDEIHAQHAGAMGFVLNLIAGGGDVPVVDQHSFVPLLANPGLKSASLENII